MKKRSLIGLILLMIFLILSCNVQAKEVPIPKAKEDVYVYDEDNLFDESKEKEINDMLVSLEKKTSSEFAVITVQSLLGKEIEDYSIKLANELGIGKEDKDNGVLLLISRSDKCVRLEIGKGLEGILNDAKCGRILDKYFVPYRENDEYTEATKLTVQAVINVIATDAGVTVDGVDNAVTAPEEDDISEGEIILIIFLIILVAFVIFIGAIGGFSDGGSSFGGGSGSGGSFGGGFGGGSFGGGGASR